MGGLAAAWGMSGGMRWRLLFFLWVLLAPADDPELRGGYKVRSLQNSANSGIQLVGGQVHMLSHPAHTAPPSWFQCVAARFSY